MSKTIKVEFEIDHVMFINGKRTFCSSGHIYRNGEKCEKRSYSIPSDYHDDLLKKGIIKNARKKKKK